MTEVWRLDHRARKRIKEVKKKARPGKENGMRFITYVTKLQVVRWYRLSSFFVSCILYA